MASDCHHHYQHHFLRQVDPEIWKACAGTSVQIPAMNSRVYYFPQGHMEQSSSPQSVISAFNHLPPRPYVSCRVLQVLLLADPDTDEVYAKIRLEPIANNESFPAKRPPPTSFSPRSSTAGFGLSAGECGGEGVDGLKDERIVSFAKVLTPSDANNGGGFSVPRFCADSVLPQLDFGEEPPVQVVTITDVRGESWSFRHIYRGTPRRHLLTTGWSKFVNSKKLIAGDSVVFMRNKETEKLYVGIRRAPKSNSAVDLSKWASQYVAMAFPGRMNLEEGGLCGRGEREGGFSGNVKGKVSPESVVEAVELAGNNRPFEVVYYPKASSREFVVAAEKVDAAMGLYWTAGMRVKMAMETEDSSRMTWLQGTVSSVSVPDCGTWQRSPWRMLQIGWDEPEALENIKRVSPWQVELVSATPPIDVAFHAPKRLRLPQNSGFMTDGETYLSLPHVGFSNSMIGHLSPSYLKYSSFPAGMQGARQDTYSFSSNIFGIGTRQQPFPLSNADNHVAPKAEIVSTDLSIGSPHSDIISPDSSSSFLSSSPEFTGQMAGSSTPKGSITSFQLFGQTIYDCSVERNNHVVGSREYVANTGTKEKEALRNPLDLCLSDPRMTLLDRIGVACPTAPAVEASASLRTSLTISLLTAWDLTRRGAPWAAPFSGTELGCGLTFDEAMTEVFPPPLWGGTLFKQLAIDEHLPSLSELDTE
ncbi:LOW QUALITY PROTEIN: hypothetical protein V2J09_013891 [Rumex salicifolius]